MPAIKIWLSRRMAEIKEDILLDAKMDFPTWERPKLRDYSAVVQTNLEGYLERVETGKQKPILDLTVPQNIDELEEKKPETQDAEAIVLLLGKMQVEVFKEIIPFENAIQKAQNSQVFYGSIVDFVKTRIMVDLFEAKTQLTKKMLLAEEKALREEEKVADKIVVPQT